MNLYAFTGNIGGDVKVNNVSGTSVANFNVAVKSGYGDKAQTIWITVALWGKQAESKLIDYLVKGQGVAVTGELSTREHEGKTYLQVRANSVDLQGGSKQEGGNSSARTPQNKSKPSDPAPADDFSDDIPF
jgi:single-strand DNA-binding protein